MPFLAPFLLLGLPSTPISAVNIMDRMSYYVAIASLWGLLLQTVKHSGSIASWLGAKYKHLALLRYILQISLAISALVLFHSIRARLTSAEFGSLLAILGCIAFWSAPIVSNRFSYLGAPLRIVWELGAATLAFKLYTLNWNWQAASFCLGLTGISAAYEVLANCKDARQHDLTRARRLSAALLLSLAPLGPLMLYYYGQLPHRYALVALCYPIMAPTVRNLADTGTQSEQLNNAWKSIILIYLFTAALAVIALQFS